jgi:hypothetical protein
VNGGSEWIMKAICLASTMTIMLLLSVTLAFRLAPAKRRARQMLLLYVACTAALVGVWLSTPDDLGFFHRSLLAEPHWLDLALMLFFFSAAFFGGILQLYNLADRGFSLRILIDALEDPSGTIGIEQLMTGYGGGRGIVCMYDKRMRDLMEGDFVRRQGESIVLSANKAWIADLFIRIRHFLRLDPR